LRLCLEEPIDGNNVMFCGIEFQTIGAANWKALSPMALVVKVTCRRLSEEERRGLEGLLKLLNPGSLWIIQISQYNQGLNHVFEIGESNSLV